MGGDDRDVEIQVLRGLGDDLQEALAKRGLRVRTYCPVGDLVAGMAYLVRRLLENTSNESFLPRAGGGPLARRAARRAMTDLPTFVNEPIGELRRASGARRAHRRAWRASSPSSPCSVPVWIGDGAAARQTS